jgi:peptidyl-prolyl cis-trans isomerase A (cyclophilin A)
MTTRSTSRTLVIIFVLALAGAVASGPIVAQETKPKPPAPETTKPKPPAPQTAKPKPASPQTTKPKPAAPTAKPGAKPTTPARGRGAGPTAAVKARLRTPAKLKDVAPATFSARFDTTAGPFVVQVHRDWAPNGADRFYNLVKYGFFDSAGFFRVVPNFMVQFGINGDPSVQSAWREANIPDDPVTQSNKRGFVTFAQTSAPNSRSTQVFINFRDNAGLDRQRFAPFGEVISGMEVVDKINPEYREKPDQGRIQMQGNAYLGKTFPKLDYINKATIVK